MAERWQQWMPFHIDRWRGSPSVQAMHPAAQMGYLNLLCSCWQSADCCVPSDPIDLATESRLGDELWALYGPRILRKFIDVAGRWRNAVLFTEWDEARRVYEKRKSGAVRTNSSRSADADRAQSPRNTDTQTLTLTGTGIDTKDQKQKPAVVMNAHDRSNFIAKRLQLETPLKRWELQVTLAAVALSEIEAGIDQDAVFEAMSRSWSDFTEARPNLDKPWGADKFFGDGYWKDQQAWPWKPDKKPKSTKGKEWTTLDEIAAQESANGRS